MSNKSPIILFSYDSDSDRRNSEEDKENIVFPKGSSESGKGRKLLKIIKSKSSKGSRESNKGREVLKILKKRRMLRSMLLGLPAFDLVRCKAVCKGWRSLISSPYFVASHLRRSKSDPSSHHLLFHNSIFRDLDEPLPGPFKSVICFSSEDMLIVGSVNGLICMAGTGNPIQRSPFTPDDIWILNPVTGLSRKLPESSRTTSFTKFAFWCDDDDDDSGGVYKVAKIVSDHNGATMLEVWVSSSPDTWTTVISTFEFHFHPTHPSVHACDVLIEGVAAYWIVAECDEDMFVVSLDFKTLVLKFNPLSKRQLCFPNDCLWYVLNGIPNSFLFCGNWNKEFVLLTNIFSGDGVYYDVWAMVMDDIGGWMKKSTICLDSFPFDKCLGIMNEKLVLTSCDDDNMGVGLYDLETGMLEVLETDSKLETISVDSARGFVGSLVSINGFGIESNDLLSKSISISWPYSYPSGRDGKRGMGVQFESLNIGSSDERISDSECW